MNIKQYLLSNACSFSLSDKLIAKIKELNIKFDSQRIEVWAWDEIDSWKNTDAESHEARVEGLVREIRSEQSGEYIHNYLMVALGYTNNKQNIADAHEGFAS